MRVAYHMSSKMQADRAVVRLAEIGAAARLLPGLPADLRGQWLEVEVAEEGAPSVGEIVHRLDPASTQYEDPTS